MLKILGLPAGFVGLILVSCEPSGILGADLGSPAPPSSPAPATGTTGVSLTATLSWAASNGATSYDIFTGTSPQLTLQATVKGLKYVMGPLKPGAKYYWKVVARNALGTKTSPVWSFTALALGQLSCDLNSDGAVNVLDVRIAENQALGVTPCGSADLNQDGVCNVVDIQRVVNAALGKGCRIGR